MALSVTPREEWLKWTEPICRWTFELMYGVNSDDLDYQRTSAILKSKPSLVFDNTSAYTLSERANLARIRTFCRQNLHTQDRPVLGLN